MNITTIPLHKRYEKILDLYPPQKGNKFLPEWYKKNKFINHYESHHNFYKGKEIAGAKNCPAIQDIITTGFVIPLWANFYFTTLDNGEYVYEFTISNATGESIDIHVNNHGENQTHGLDLEKTSDGMILKLMLPYWFQVPEGYNLLFTDPFYHFRKDIRCLSGVVEGDKWGTIQVVFEILKPEFHIEAGTPLIHVIPYRRETLNFTSRNGEEEEYKAIEKKMNILDLKRTNYKSLFSE